MVLLRFAFLERFAFLVVLECFAFLDALGRFAFLDVLGVFLSKLIFLVL